MDLRKMKNEDKLNLCRKYYLGKLGGFALLPFLWLVNTLWFFKEAFINEPYQQQKQIRTYVIRSGIGTLICTGAFIAWVVVFQLHRAEWGETADRLSFIIPRGIA
ncbi:unnamed protein product [Owenia fusiformis]|uniref:Gamma-secretase subunit PEN-2 n=1 Tax=Owenia fusiformis TaxID=6347 RepID=A0A8S4PPQ1_OWEFU|nr:unnamed protein product [Owenia fusiformis]